ncbi:hypothetical protein D0Z07_5979 [Hyphodiscus hymeniophilus]|uniref:Rhodopsin domain-containing protein n=1 Tax=Hyphodiscus hymeniophilus TaxID=353542 RepID=A0A9P6VH52_9HELO|nr:hypothetical protein D0Z07_5979 [Hyphodiscus hymeniophilus]
MSGAGTLPPLFIITDDDRGGYVCVVLYTLLILMLVTVVARLFTRWYIVRFIKSDDILLALAMVRTATPSPPTQTDRPQVLGIVQSVIVQLAVNHGLGKKRAIISDSSFGVYEKQDIARSPRQELDDRGVLDDSEQNFDRSDHYLGILLNHGTRLQMWATSAMGVHREMHQSAAFNIITDAALILLPCTVFWKVQVSRSKRWRILALFATRIIVCAATAVQIHYFNVLVKSSDKTWANINSSMWEQCVSLPSLTALINPPRAVMNLSIIATAIPSLGRLIVELQPAVNAFAITEHHGTRTGGDKYALSSFAGRFPQHYTLEHELGTRTSVRGARRQSSKADSESTQGLRQNMIQQTIDFKIY